MSHRCEIVNYSALYPFTKDLHLLYVEDDREVVEQSTPLFEMFFKTVTVAFNGQEGLEQYRAAYYEQNHAFDLVITDLNMPVLHGIEMIKEILNIEPKQHITVISAQDEPSMLLELINIGIGSFLLKPLQEQQFFDVLYKICKAIHDAKVSDRYQNQITRTNEYLESEVEKRAKALETQLYTDHLTCIENRLALTRDLESEHYKMLALIDIDKFQFVNDLYGTNIGNEIIKQFANYLNNKIDKNYFKLYRTSGDEFAICSTIESQSLLEPFVKKLSNALIHLPLYISDIEEEIFVDATIGVSFDTDHLLTQADIALKHAKHNQKPVIVYEASMNTLEKMQNTLNWKRRIQYAVAHDNIVPVFQPIVDQNGTILKYETLMRLKEEKDAETTLISPYFFLETAIATKQYAKLSRMIIQKALQKLIECDCTLSINLTYSDFSDQEIINLLDTTLKLHPIGERLIFEIVESENITDYKVLHKFIKQFRQYGVKVAIDDFGSGFSNFDNIIQSKPDFIKIDGSLIKHVDKNRQIQVMVGAIAQVAQKSGIKIVAEFVHSKEVFEVLKTLKIDEYQGFYFYEPALELAKERNHA